LRLRRQLPCIPHQFTHTRINEPEALPFRINRPSIGSDRSRQTRNSPKGLEPRPGTCQRTTPRKNQLSRRVDRRSCACASERSVPLRRTIFNADSIAT
jgi:hypothetical protein